MNTYAAYIIIFICYITNIRH